MLVYIILYVDDMLLVINNMDVIMEMKLQLSSKFDVDDLSASHLILGMDIKRDRIDRRLSFSKSKYVETILKCFNM